MFFIIMSFCKPVTSESSASDSDGDKNPLQVTLSGSDKILENCFNLTHLPLQVTGSGLGATSVASESSVSDLDGEENVRCEQEAICALTGSAQVFRRVVKNVSPGG